MKLMMPEMLQQIVNLFTEQEKEDLALMKWDLCKYSLKYTY